MKMPANNADARLARIRAALLATAVLAMALGLPRAAVASGAISAQEAHDIAVDAYIYFYPLVSMAATRQETNTVPGAPANSLTNRFHHVREFPSADFKVVVRSNFDTLYSSAWLDLTEEPMIVSAPDTHGRYYILPMLDMWTDVFAAPGKRTSGTAAAHFAVVPPGWSGSLPDGVTRIDAPTPYVWIVGRTQTNGPSDYPAVHEIQDGYVVTPLSQWGRSAAVQTPLGPTNMKAPAPLNQVNGMAPFAYFKLAAEVMKINRPHITDWSIVERLKRIGFAVGQSYEPERLDPVVQEALREGAADGLKAMRAKIPTLARVVNGWQMNTDTVGVYGNAYLKRAAVALVLLAANAPEDAVYPLIVTDAGGKVPTGDHRYVLHFTKEGLPPVNAFWSLTMYDSTGFQVANPINRFALGDRDPMTYNSDGSLDIYVQHEDPGGQRTGIGCRRPARAS